MNAFEQDDDSVSNLTFNQIKRLLKFVAPYKHRVFISIFFMFVSVALGVGFPLISKIAIDDYIIKTYHTVEINKLPQDKNELTQIPHIPLDHETIAISGSLLNKPDYQFLNLIASKTHYYLFKKSELPNLKNLTQIGDYWLVPESELNQIPPTKLSALRGSDWRGVLNLTVIAFLVLMATFISKYLQIYYSSKAAQDTMIDLRCSIFSHIEGLSMDFFSKQQIGRLVTRATNDISALQELLSSVLIQAWHDLLILFGTLFILFFLNWKLALCITITVPVFVATTLFFQKKLQNVYRQSRHLLSTLNAHLAEDIAGFKIIRIFRQHARRKQSYNAINKNYYKSTFNEIKWFGIFRPSVEVICALGLTIVFIYGGQLTLNGVISIGVFYTFITYVERMFKPLAAMIDKYNIMLSAAAASERLITILDEKPTILSPAQPASQTTLQGNIAFENVTFSYIENQPILKNINLTIPTGKSIAIVGPTGSGKSTIINLLCRFYDVNSGEIRLDGTPIQHYSLDVLRQHIAIVLQESFIFSRSIADNIAMGGNYTKEEIEAAAKRLQIHQFIQTLPQQYDTIMEERGATLSAGQRQLICFARALIHNPSILILDEATSNIDPETEELIQNAIEQLIQNRTCLIIAHRLSTIRKANQIIVLDDGRIIEQGTHDELIAKHGAYYNLYLLQYKHQEHT